MSTRFPATWWLMVSAMLAGCAAPSLRPPAPAHVPPQVRDARRDADVIPRCADRMTSASADLSRMSQSDVGRQRGFLSPPEQDAVERSFAGYLSCRNELNRIAAHYRAAAPRDASDPARAWDAELVRSATAARIHGDALLVSAVQDNPVLFRTLNQACYRSGIPRGAFDDIVYNLTDSRTLAELDEPLPSAAAPAGSPLQLASFAEDSRPGRFAVPSARNTAATKKLVDELVQRRSRLFPAATNELWHAPPTRVLVGAGSALRDGYFDAQSGLVTRIGRIKNPLTKRLMISTEQQREIHSALRPGDVLLTYTAGVASNLFVPGAFKHALTYVGTDAQRRNSGLTPEHIAMLDEPRRERLLPALRQTTLVTGEPAEMAALEKLLVTVGSSSAVTSSPAVAGPPTGALVNVTLPVLLV